jgi:hypothetical protein
MGKRLFHALLWLDVKILWALTFGNCRPGETISAAAWSLYLDGKWQGRLFVPIIDCFFRYWQRSHCLDAYRWQIDLYQD